MTNSENNKTDEARRMAIIELARAEHQSEGVVEIDDNALLSEGQDNGCYVAAWVWVGFAQTPFDKEKPCDACGDKGWLSCNTGNDAAPQLEIQRCDACVRYENDQAARAAAAQVQKT